MHHPGPLFPCLHAPSPQPPTSSPLLSLSSNSNPYRCLEAPRLPPRGCAAQISTTAILDSGASDIYFAPDAPVTNVNPSAPTSTVTDAAGTHHHSSAHANHLLPTLPACSGKIMPSFKHTLFGVGPLCDNGCKVLFDSASATIYDKRATPSSSKGGVNPQAPSFGASRCCLIPSPPTMFPIQLPATRPLHSTPPISQVSVHLFTTYMQPLGSPSSPPG
eukprot:CCRYP_009709-RA/>CCRYP_009709-RA protein AED:0.46 eAED:0.41 QI:0/-1/0/1/-1/1/1/0/217